MDKYDAAIQYYNENPNNIAKDWGMALRRDLRAEHSVLYNYLTRSGLREFRTYCTVGCPAMIAYNSTTSKWLGYQDTTGYAAETLELTEAVKKIPNLPDPQIMATPGGLGVTIEHLQALATAQRLADELLGRS